MQIAAVNAPAWTLLPRGASTPLEVRQAIVPFVPAGDLLHESWLAWPRREHVGGNGHLGIGIGLEVTLGGREGPVHRPVAHPEVPWLLGVALFTLEVVNRPVCVVVGGVTRGHDGLAAIGLDELVLVVVACVLRIAGTVPHLLEIPVASRPGVGAGVPLADLGRLVAMLPKDFGPKGTFLGIVFTAGILALHAHALDPVLVMPRQQGGP